MHFGVGDFSGALDTLDEPVGTPELPSGDPDADCAFGERCDASGHPSVAVTHTITASTVTFRLILAEHSVNTDLDTKARPSGPLTVSALKEDVCIGASSDLRSV
jgi:hypothetical protein